jgi:hypothetical protein
MGVFIGEMVKPVNARSTRANSGYSGAAGACVRAAAIVMDDPIAPVLRQPTAMEKAHHESA